MDDNLAIRTEGLTKHYRGSFWRLRPEPAIADLDLLVPRSTVFGFLGPNGAGKTTTIRCLMDLIRPTKGKAWVLSKPCGDIKVREKVGYLPDTPAFGSHLTAGQFLNICARLLKIPKADRGNRVEEVLHIVRMTEHRNQDLNGFSRGMLQRVGVAQALLNKPELLILDEPLVGLDPEGRKELLQILRERKEEGVCVFFCSHILHDVENLCDRIGILSRGRLKLSGPLSKLLSSNGCNVTVPAAQEEFAKELLSEADGSRRGKDGQWILEFEDEARADEIQDRELPDGVTVEGRRESLEDLFFRMTRGLREEEEDHGHPVAAAANEAKDATGEDD